MNESAIEKAVCQYAREKGLLSFKFVSPAHRGVPDRLFISQGEVFFIEFKAPGKKPTLLQQRTIDKISSYNIKVFICDNIAKGKRIIDDIIQNAKT